MGRLLGWLSATHTLRYRAHNHREYPGHLYQGPFKSFPVAGDEHFYVVCRYVERNALRANLVSRAAEWVEEIAERHGLWSSLRPVGRPRGNRK
jgi:putative transposase